MKKTMGLLFVCVLLMGGLSASAFAATLLSPTEIGFDGQTRSDNYDTLIDALYANSAVVTTINGQLWVPWFTTSSRSLESDLQSGSNCNSGDTIDFAHNCMVTDEFSQVGVLVSMGADQSRMDEFYNTVVAIKSTNGNLPSWRVYRNGNSIEPCNDRINSNCDTASDADARIITALLTAVTNEEFTDVTMKERYEVLAIALADDVLALETEHTCRPTAFGTVCNWLAGGSRVSAAGIGATDFAYTGYYADAVVAMLATYSNTNDEKYLIAAQDFTANYLQAARFDGEHFTAPPGKSFRWVTDTRGQPQAQCTNTCNPEIWDVYDASRALGMCQANYYANQMGVELHNLAEYCSVLGATHMSDPTSAPLQFRPDGSAGSSQSGYFAQGLQSLHQSGVSPRLFEATLDNALSHYSPLTGTFDNAPSFGVYTPTFVVRALGMGIGRDAAAFSSPMTAPIIVPTISDIASLTPSCSADGIACTIRTDVTSGSCRTIVWSTEDGDFTLFGCEKPKNTIELYVRTVPRSSTYEACLNNGCVSNHNGFARFTPVDTLHALPVTSLSPTPIQDPKTIGTVTVECTVNGVRCTKTSDITSGVCRTIEWTSAGETIQVLGCEKGGGSVELYRQVAPSDVDFTACMEGVCVDGAAGFAKFQL